MNTLTKIERLQKAERVDEMLASGITSASQIHKILISEGVDISKSAVNSYIKKAIDHIKPEAFKIVSDHIGTVIPDDMESLEAMEKQLLKWAGEDPLDAADRLAQARSNIERDVDQWIFSLNLPNTASDQIEKQKEKERRIQWIMKKCLNYILMDSRLQKKRIEAMNGAIRIIGLKLQHISILEGEGKGNIIIMDSSADYKAEKDGKYIPFPIQKSSKPEDKS